MEIKQNGVELRVYNLKELASLYKINPKTMKAWLERHRDTIGDRMGHYYIIPQVEIIFKIFGLPGFINDDIR